MSLSPLEFGLISTTPGYAAARALFDDDATVAAYLRFEAALARAEARAGVIPPEAAAKIAAACRTEVLDMDRLRREATVVGYPIVALVAQLSEAAGDAGGWVHWGATTQDVMDTGLMLQLRDAIGLALAGLDRVCGGLAALASAHRGTVMTGRSKLQHAAPITFGYKVAVWLSQLDRCRARLRRLRGEGLWLQFGGAVGTLSALGDAGLRVREGLAAELDLIETPITWHVARDGLCEIVHAFALVNGALAKLGCDVALLMATEVDEVREPYVPGRGTSSTMPQKRNPVLSESLIAAARLAREAVGFMLDAMVQDHERAAAVGPAEYRQVAQSACLAVGALDLAGSLVEGIEVDAAHMADNLDVTRGLLMAEAAMMALAPEIGRDRAHALVHRACHAAHGRPLIEVLAAAPGIPAAALAEAMRPEGYLGVAREMTDAVAAPAHPGSDAPAATASPGRTPRANE